MQLNQSEVEKFRGLQRLAYQVLIDEPKARFSKQFLVYKMWILDPSTSSVHTLSQFAIDMLNDRFKIESYTRAARKVVEKFPQLGNPKRKELAEKMKITIKESDVNPDQIELELDYGNDYSEFMAILEEISNV